jgi:hypothetical protein
MMTMLVEVTSCRYGPFTIEGAASDVRAPPKTTSSRTLAQVVEK